MREIDCVFPLDYKCKVLGDSPRYNTREEANGLTQNAIWSQSTPMSYLKSVDAFKVFNPGRLGFHLIIFPRENDHTQTDVCMST